MRRLLGMLAAALLALTLSACGDDGGGDDKASDDSSTTTTDSDTNNGTVGDAERQAATQLADRLQEAAGGLITDDQATCIADKFLEATDLNKLAEQMAAGQDPRADPALQSTLLSALIGCVPPEVLSQLQTQSTSSG